jgi:hypothetical protein
VYRNEKNVYGEGLLAPLPSFKLENYSFSALLDCLYNIFPATLHIGSNLRTLHAVVTGTHLSWSTGITFSNIERGSTFLRKIAAN